MSNNISKPKIIVIVGPTASGKSDLAIKIARRFNGEIISADSRQVYRKMDIGTGKVKNDKWRVTSGELRRKQFYSEGIRHHLLDVASPKTQFTVDDYKRLGKKAINDISARGKLPIICGGTGLYVDYLVNDSPLPSVPPDLKLRKKLEALTTENLFKKLIKLDPRRADNIDRHNRRRLIRALEIVLVTGKPVPQLTDNPKLINHSIMWLGITWPKEVLQKRILKRLDARIKIGMLAEVKRLHDGGVSWPRLERFGLEYKWQALYLQKKITRAQMHAGLYKAICDYAKRQMTWFKRNKNIHWVKNQNEASGLVKNWMQNN